MKKIPIVLFAYCLIACASGYSKFYTPVPGATSEVISKTRVSPPPAVPIVERLPTMPDPDHYVRRGYAPIGYSSFNSGNIPSEKGAIEQGKKVGADLVVIIKPSYTGSVTSQLPITTPTTSTSHTRGTATAYGSAGVVTAYGHSTTTTYGSKTTYIPMTVNRYNYGAVYFVKRNYILGAHYRDLTDKERYTLQSNKGVYIKSIVNDTPAFRNDVLAGDIITKIDEQVIYGIQDASEALKQKRGQKVQLVIFRNGQTIEKEIRLAQ